MCGITGIFQARDRALSREVLAERVATMNAAVSHRGPDAEGMWVDNAARVALGHRRLSVIDTSEAGRQPFVSHDGRYHLTYNGEIYNYRDVALALDAAGVAMRGRTDTEVLIEALALWGPDALPRLDGMFAFALFDAQEGSLLVARDPFGEKPLYMMDAPGGGLAFASELQAIEGLPGFDAKIDRDALAEMLSFEYVGAPRTIYRAVKKLAPGHWLKIDATGGRITGRYFAFRPGEGELRRESLPVLADELEDILTRSIRRRLIADVPLGAFLSGGVDSSTVCALVAAKLKLPLKTYSLGFADTASSEHDAARAFAAHLGTEHHEEIIAPAPGAFLMNLGALQDEPNGDSSCLPTYALSRFAREAVTVAISGDGGDELFGGYRRYAHTLQQAARHGADPAWSAGAAYYSDRFLAMAESDIAGLLGDAPEGYAGHLRALRAEIDQAGPALLDALRRHDAAHYLPGGILAKVDRMSMRHALEVRTPFLNVELARFAEKLPESALISGGRGKVVLRELAYRYLPRHLIDRKKQGFSLPRGGWARDDLLKAAKELLDPRESRLARAFGASPIERFLAARADESGFDADRLWTVLTLESWLRNHKAVF